MNFPLQTLLQSPGSTTENPRWVSLMEPDGESEFSEQTQTIDPGSGSPFRVILYNDDWHSMDEVVNQLQKATGCTVEKAVNITLEVDARGRGVCYHGDRDNCHRVAGVLREIRLQVEVDCD